VAGTAYADFGFLHEGICVFTRKRRAKLLMAGAALAAAAVLTPLSASAATTTHTATATAVAASPATVAVRSGWFGLQAHDQIYCLDSNAQGNVYVLPCQVPGNKFQDWNWTEWEAYSPYQGYYYFYSIQDQATGRCLDSNAGGAVYTSPCQAPGNAYQDWYWGAGDSGWPGYAHFTDVATSRPLWGSGGDPVLTYQQIIYNNWLPIQ
jgi:hypothetical protein